MDMEGFNSTPVCAAAPNQPSQQASSHPGEDRSCSDAAHTEPLGSAAHKADDLGSSGVVLLSVLVIVIVVVVVVLMVMLVVLVVVLLMVMVMLMVVFVVVVVIIIIIILVVVRVLLQAIHGALQLMVQHFLLHLKGRISVPVAMAACISRINSHWSRPAATSRQS